MTSTITITTASAPVEPVPTPDPQPEPIKYLYWVKPWGYDEIMTNFYKDASQLNGGSNFQVIQDFVPDTGTWSAVSNHVQVGRREMDALIALNQKFGDPGSYEFYVLMNWIVNQGTGARPMWGGDWRKDSTFYYGTMLFGGQYVQILDSQTFYTGRPANKTKTNVEMGLIRSFEKSDLEMLIAGEMTPETHPHLIPQCTSVYGDNVLNWTPKGMTMFCPIWGTDWKASFKSKQLYMPFECLVPVSQL